MRKLLMHLAILGTIVSCGSSGGGGSGVSVIPPVIEPPVVYDKADPHNMKEISASVANGAGVVVGIVDHRFDVNNPEFQEADGTSRMIEDTRFTDTSNTGHGNGVAEILGGKTSGVAPKITMIGAAAGKLQADGVSEYINLREELYTNLYDNGVRIFNQSFGIPSRTGLNSTQADFPLTDPVIKFYHDKATTDSLFIWAGGNGGGNEVQMEAGLPYLYPEIEKGWIAVVAGDPETGLINPTSNKCGVAMNWCITAVGGATSGAAPVIAGTAGLIQQKYPWMNGDLMRQTILSTAIDKGDTGVDSTYGWGLVNISKAVKGPALFDKRLAFGEHVNVDFDTVTSTFENNISGDAGIIKSGTGNLILAGNNTYTGTNIVNTGTLTVNGKVISKVNVKPKGTLSSNGGYIDNDVINEGGTFINNEKGTTITGDYIADTGSIIKVAAKSTIDVKGKVALSDSKLEVLPLKDSDNNPVYISASENITNKIITADKGIESEFAIIEASVLLDTEVKYNSDNVELNLNRKDVTLYATETYSSDNTRDNVASNVEQVFRVLDDTTDNKEFRIKAAELQQTATSKSLASTFDSLSGQIYASAQALTFQQSQSINKDLSNKLVMLGSFENIDNKVGVWFNALGSTGKLYESGYAKADTSLYGGHIGVDKVFDNKFILGTSVAYSSSKADFDRYAGESKSQNVSISGYGRYGLKDDNFYVFGRIGAGYVTSDVERDVVIGGVVENLSIDHNDYIISGYGEAGYKIKASSNIDITPFVGLSYDNVKRGSFSEDGSLFGLKADSKTYNQTTGLIGIRAETGFDWIAGKSTLQGYFTWQKAFNDEDLSFEASYVGMSSQKFKVKGIELADETVWGGVGISTEVTPTWTWYANYDLQLEKSKEANNVFSVGARINLD